MDIVKVRRFVNKGQIADRDQLLKRYSVTISNEKIAGVNTSVVTPISGISSAQQKRVIINLHGGGMLVGAPYGGQIESIPMAALTGIRVIAVDYRMAPEFHFPAASEDVAAVYRELLKTYPAQNIGIYGCSAGAGLTAQSVAWFQKHGLPRPGAIGMFSLGAGVYQELGDSSYIGPALSGAEIPGNYFAEQQYVVLADLKNPLESPVIDRSILQSFPPTLLLSGTRDGALSSVLHTHSHLVDAGADAELHVWEGADHCFMMHNLDIPEAQQAWKVIVNFFESHLGREPR
jgi:acetyl esterase/lipase